MVQIRIRCSKAQKIINRGLYWSYGFKSRNSYVSLYDITRELRIPPLSAVCAISQLRSPEWTVANLTGSSITYSKGSKFSCIDHIIYNKAMIPHVHLSSACSFANDIFDLYPIFLSCNKNLHIVLISLRKLSNCQNIFVILRMQMYYLIIIFLF